MGNWSELPRDLLSAIARRLETAADGARFSGVCRNWSSLAKLDITNLPRDPPWLMLTEKLDSDDRDFVGEDGKCFSLKLPNGRGSRCIGSNGCWVVMIDEAYDINILNPFSGEKIDLPSLRPLEDIVDIDDPEREDILDFLDSYVPKVILTFPNSQSPREDFIAVAKYALSTKLAYTRKGAKSWQPVESIQKHNYFLDVICYKDKFFAVNHSGIVFKFNVLDEKPYAVPISDPLTILGPPTDFHCPQRNLVEFRGLVLQVLNLVSTMELHEIHVFKLDFTSGGWVELKDLGQYSVFLGYNTGVSLLATSNYTFKSNCIYFCTGEFLRIHFDGKRFYVGVMGVFNLADSTILPYYEGPYLDSGFARPVWIVPTSLSQNQ